MSDDTVTEAQAIAMLRVGFEDASCHPACIAFRLRDGSVLTLWDAGYERDRHWTWAS